jgi:hypothetical protein
MSDVYSKQEAKKEYAAIAITGWTGEIDGATDSLLTLFEYQTFDPLKIFMVMNEIARKSKRDLEADVNIVIAWYVKQGPKRVLGRRLKPEAQTKFNEVKDIYGIKGTNPDGGASSYTSSTITISRVALTFPHYTATFIAQGKAKPVIPYEKYKLPACYQWQGGPSLWTPTDLLAYEKEYLAWADEFDSIIKQKTPAKRTPMDRIKGYMTASINSAIFTKKEKEVIKTKLYKRTLPKFLEEHHPFAVEVDPDNNNN